MIGIYKTIENELLELETFETDCWINMVNPSREEIQMVVDFCEIEADFVRAALDEEETSRIESEDGQSLIIVDIPYANSENKFVTYETVPLGIIISKKAIVTVCLRQSNIIEDFYTGRVKQVVTFMKTRFLLQLLYRVAGKYLLYLRQIDRISANVEKTLHRSMRNKELIQLLDLEKSLVFFSTSLKGTEITLEKIMRGRFIKMYEEDQELLEDVLIEIKQAIEMSNIYSNILSGTMDAFASIISNNLNIVMKVLTVITILMAIPTMIASFYGMNVEGIPYPNFWFVLGISAFVTGATAMVLFKKKMF